MATKRTSAEDVPAARSSCAGCAPSDAGRARPVLGKRNIWESVQFQTVIFVAKTLLQIDKLYAIKEVQVEGL